MPKRVGVVAKEELVAVPLPPATATYTVISHGFVINNVLKILQAKGFEVIKQKYTCNDGGQVATGQYQINYGDDPELGMLFAFSNSYDKSLRFRCAIGGFVRLNDMSVLGDTASSWGRKHTGSADDETIETIEQQIDNAHGYFKQLKADKEKMMKIKLTTRQYAELLGRLYLDIKMLSGEQLRVVKREFEKPTFAYTTEADSLWTLYNHIIVALSKCHPRTWMEQQKLVHLHIMAEYQLTMFDKEPQAKDPNQLDLVEEAEKLVGFDDNPEIPSQEEINKGNYAEAAEPEVLTADDFKEFDELPTSTTETVQMTKEEITEKFPEQAEEIIQATKEIQTADTEEIPDILPVELAPETSPQSIAEEVDQQIEIAEETSSESAVAPVPESVAEEKPKPTIKMKDAIEKYGHLISEEQRGLMLKGKGSAESLTTLRAAHLADLEEQEKQTEQKLPSQEVQAVTNPEEVSPKQEEITPVTSPAAPVAVPVKGEDTSKLPPVPTQSKSEAIEVESIVESDEKEGLEGLDNSEFFMSKSDLNDMYPGTTLALGFVVHMMDQDFEITTCKADADEYGLTLFEPLANSEPAILGADSPEEIAEVKEALANTGLAKPTKANGKAPVGVMQEEIQGPGITSEAIEAARPKIDPQQKIAVEIQGGTTAEPTSMKEVGMEEQQAATEEPLVELDPEPQPIATDFEIGDAEVGAPAESMLATTSVKEDLAPEPTAEDLAIRNAIETEIEDLYGAKIPFTYKLSGNQYNVKLETGETVVLTEAYINSLNAE